MPAKRPVTGSVQPVHPRLNAAERRAAQAAAISTKQAELKQETAARRHARELRDRSTSHPTPPSKHNPAS
jgi:hypothetical protein